MKENFKPNPCPNEWEQFFDKEASNYLENIFTKGTEKEIPFLLEELQLRDGASILDVGCGVGRHAIPLAKMGFRVTGIDQSSGMLNQARKTAESLGVAVDLIHIDASKFKTDTRFHAAVCLCEGALSLVGSNHDIEAFDRLILTNVLNCLKPGGKFIITTMNGFKAIRQYSDDDVAAGKFDPLVMIETEPIKPTGLPDGPEFVVKQRQYIPSEFAMLMKSVGFEVLHIWHGTAGDWKREMLKLDDWEFMVVAKKPGE